MGMFVAIRGWLEFDHRQRADLERIIAGADGWAFPDRPGSWTLYALYGADLRESAVADLRAQVAELARLDPVDEDNDWPAGFFLLSDERQRSTAWVVRDGQVADEPAPAELRWFAERP